MNQNEFNPIGIDGQLDWPRIRKLLSIGLFAAILTLIGDMMIGWGIQDETQSGLIRMFSAYRHAENSTLFAAALLGMFGIFLEGLSYFGIYRLMAEKSSKHAHNFRIGIIGYIVFGPCGFHVPICMMLFLYRSLTEAGAENVLETVEQFADYFIAPSLILFWIFFLILEGTQISAFLKGKTPYPKWCFVFSLPVGMLIAKLFNIFGNHAFVNAIDCAWISVGNIWMFAGLLLMMKKAQEQVIQKATAYCGTFWKC